MEKNPWMHIEIMNCKTGEIIVEWNYHTEYGVTTDGWAFAQPPFLFAGAFASKRAGLCISAILRKKFFWKNFQKPLDK